MLYEPPIVGTRAALQAADGGEIRLLVRPICLYSRHHQAVGAQSAALFTLDTCLERSGPRKSPQRRTAPAPSQIQIWRKIKHA